MVNENASEAITWRPSVEWMKAFAQKGETNDMAVDQFKKFFTTLQAEYCNHFGKLEEVVEEKLEYLLLLKE
jgi:hypothetical protein